MAEACARELDEGCPICEEARLVVVTFAFGSGLPLGGRCVASSADVARLRRHPNAVTCYLVEVCRGCGWNHVRASFPLSGTGDA